MTTTFNDKSGRTFVSHRGGVLLADCPCGKKTIALENSEKMVCAHCKEPVPFEWANPVTTFEMEST